MDILMPQLGETVTEGKIITWYKSVGDQVAAGDSLFEIETDKTSMEVPTTTDGVLAKIYVQSGATVPVGAVVAVLSSAADSQPLKLDPFNAVRTPERTFGPATLANGVKATPVARRLAAMNGIDLNRINGSGPQGRVVAKDVKNAGFVAVAPSVQPPRGTAQGALRPAGADVVQVKALFADVPYEEVALDGMRHTIARRLLDAKQTVPHFYLNVDVSMDKLITLRAEINAQTEGRLKVSVNDFVIRAVALGLQRVPQANVVWAEDRLLRFTRSDIGVAVAIEGGLITPIIRSAESKSLRAISDEMKSLAERARSKGLRPGEYQGGSISISNLGMFGVRSFSAIINPPQSAMLAVGAAERRPLEGPDGRVYFGSVMTATLSCDHRVIDGVLGARFLAAFKDLLQSPLALLL